MTMKGTRGGLPLLVMALLSGLAFLSLVVMLPFVQLNRVPVVAAPPQPLSASNCLSQEEPFHRFSLPVIPEDESLVVPGAAYKENKGSFGSSAVPTNYDSLTPQEALDVVHKTFVDWHCGVDGLYGGDPKLYQVGLLAQNPFYNVNTTVADDRVAWAIGLDEYLASINWEKSYVTVAQMPEGMWTLTMSAPGGPEPFVSAIAHTQPRSHYLVLAFDQPDGSTIWDWRRLECGFQPTYRIKGDVPAALRP